MVQFRVLTGRQAGQSFTAQRFPWTLGRSATTDLPLAEEGVWDRHLELRLQEPEGFVLTVLPPAIATLNGQPFQSAILRSGDLIELGSVKLQFWLSETRLRDWHWHEWITWLFLALLGLAQVALVYWLSAY